ncbi:PREDICTED: uncharacterized protein LOC109583515 [Amphimedon queenslandica]|uniref:Uncharacterized protein n=1 Tax=Amphimedon queenslandica TaxID=400682 RepID=A0A1X7UFL7_AMPQE|nr:PREDICTED: uncharacterized protein LOC109583515 [Amphimedon queenslandica]|eukprot:XP_019854463.1 PREDICTED: uncharacterized protein LOC109583515 [Amphimedon queenslandica]
MNNETSSPEERSLVHTSNAIRDVTINVEGNKLCVYYELTKGCVDIDKACGAKVNGFSIGCADDEELFHACCYKKCSLVANKHFPLRTERWTCARNGCTSSQEYDAGLCYPKCKEYYIGVATVCWGYCSHFCGKDYTDMGLYCYRWWPPHSCYKPRYDRGVGSLPYQPWIYGGDCWGFGVNNEGKCALLDVSSKVPIDLGCKKQ